MSAYVVNDKTISRVLSYLTSPEFKGNFDSPLEGSEYRSYSQREAIDKLGAEMRLLNEQAINHRYDEAKEMGMIPEEFFAFVRVRTTAVQAFKSLCCWLYQCNEGECDNTKLYKRMSRLRDDLAVDIVFNLPEFDQAEWG